MREIQVGVKAGPLDAIRKDSILSSLANMSSAQIVSAAAGAKQLSQGLYNGSAFWNAQMDTMNAKQDAYQAARLVSPNGVTRITQFETVVEPKHSDSQITSEGQTIPGQPLHRFIKSNQKDQHVILQVNPLANPVPVDQPLEAIDIRQISDKFPNKNFEDMYDKSINKDCFYLVKFWADISYEMDANEMEAFYSTTQWFESVENVTIQVSTQVVSFAKKTVEKIETEVSKMDANTGRYICKFDKSPVCEYMVNFIHKLKHLPDPEMINTVLENFTLLQHITNRTTGELMYVIAFVFEATDSGGPYHHIYQLVKNLGHGGVLPENISQQTALHLN